MENIELLNKILELCEKNFDEGTYLQSATILKNINEKKIIENNERIIIFENPLIISNGDKSNDNIFKITGVIQVRDTTEYHIRKIICYFDEIEMILGTSCGNYSFRNRCQLFERKLIFWFRLYKIRDIDIHNCVGCDDDTIMTFTLREHYKHMYELAVACSNCMACDVESGCDCDIALGCDEHVYLQHLENITRLVVDMIDLIT